MQSMCLKKFNFIFSYFSTSRVSSEVRYVTTLDSVFIIGQPCSNHDSQVSNFIDQ